MTINIKLNDDRQEDGKTEKRQIEVGLVDMLACYLAAHQDQPCREGMEVLYEAALINFNSFQSINHSKMGLTCYYSVLLQLCILVIIDSLIGCLVFSRVKVN